MAPAKELTRIRLSSKLGLAQTEKNHASRRIKSASVALRSAKGTRKASSHVDTLHHRGEPAVTTIRVSEVAPATDSENDGDEKRNHATSIIIIGDVDNRNMVGT